MTSRESPLFPLDCRSTKTPRDRGCDEEVRVPPSHPLVLLLRLAAPDALVLAFVLAAHHPLVPGALAALPEAPALLADDAAPAEPARLHGVVLLAAAPPADHPVRPLVEVVLGLVVALVAAVHLLAAREPEPAERALVVAARPVVGQRVADVQAQLLLVPLRARRRRQRPAVADGEELYLGDLELEFAVALAADVGGDVAPYRHQSDARSRAPSARGNHCAVGALVNETDSTRRKYRAHLGNMSATVQPDTSIKPARVEFW